MTINTELYFYNQLKILLNQGNLKPNEYTGILKSGTTPVSFDPTDRTHLIFHLKRDIWTSIFHLFKIMTSPIHFTGFMSDDF